MKQKEQKEWERGGHLRYASEDEPVEQKEGLKGCLDSGPQGRWLN